jgi:hypothetical protein
MTTKRAQIQIWHIPKYISLAIVDGVNRSTERGQCQNDVALRIPDQSKDTSETGKVQVAKFQTKNCNL